MAVSPFSVPTLSEELEAVFQHWRSLIRGNNNMPFWDDFAPHDLGDRADSCLLLDVFDKPLRFRFSSGVLGAKIAQRASESVSDMFTDEVAPEPPFDFLNAQGSATVETRAPTFYKGGDYARLALPMWGDGRVGMILVAYDWN